MIHPIINKLRKGIHVLTFKTEPLSLYNYQPFTETRLNDNLKLKCSNLILTTYFTSKEDPQRQERMQPNDFSYIEDFYKSIIENGLSSVIFYDTLSEEFIKKYSNENVQFLKVKPGNYSLNDERFLIYHEFLQKHHFNKIILCDISDVVVKRKNVFQFIKSNKLYIGKDEKNSLKESFWILDKISKLPMPIKAQLPNRLYSMPLVNAGVIGGDYNTIRQFLLKLKNLIAHIDNDLNNNMVCVNLVFFDLYWRKFINSAYFKINYILNTRYYNKLIGKTTIDNPKFHIGTPFVSEFKKYENPNSSNHYIYHK